MAVRRAAERGVTKLDWLESYHSFSFGDYYDPAHAGFRLLRVLNDDIVAPNMGFGAHGHKNMEIISIVLDGALEHRDSLGNGSVIVPGEVQVMSAGTGIEHSEFNSSTDEPVHFLQIWIVPNQKNVAPRYEQRSFALADRLNTLQQIVGPLGTPGVPGIHQQASLFLSRLERGKVLPYQVQPKRGVWLQLVSGGIECNGELLLPGDGVGVDGARELSLKAGRESELLIIDLP